MAILKFGVHRRRSCWQNCYVEDTASILATDQSTGIYTDTATLQSSVGPNGTGGVDGTVIDANNGNGIPNAYVFLQLGDEYYDTYSNSDGVYILMCPPVLMKPYRLRQATVRLHGFCTPQIEPNVSVTSDLTMTAPLMEWSRRPQRKYRPWRTVHRQPLDYQHRHSQSVAGLNSTAPIADPTVGQSHHAVWRCQSGNHNSRRLW